MPKLQTFATLKRKLNPTAIIINEIKRLVHFKPLPKLKILAPQMLTVTARKRTFDQQSFFQCSFNKILPHLS